jgi:hypothetical protein
MKKVLLAKLFPVCALLAVWLLPHAGFGNVPYQCNTQPNMVYFGGPVLANVQVVPVFYGPLVNSQVITSMPQFYADITSSNSTYWPWLCEYDTPSQHIGFGTATAGYVLSGVATTVKLTRTSDAALQTLLVQQVAMGVLPPPNSNTIYMVHFPPFVQLTGPGGNGASCIAFCAYHNSFVSGTNVYVYAAIMDTFSGGCSAGCGGNSTGLANQTDVASHELIEAVTDPYVGLDTGANYAYPCGWGDNNCGELADICADNGPGDTVTVSGRSWVVQEIWSQCQNGCVSTGPVPVAKSQHLTIFPETPVPITLTMSNASSFCHYHLFVVTHGPAHGVLSGTLPNLTYTPATGFTGEDSFQFTANGSPGTVSITVALMITSADFDVTKTNFVVCWNAQPGASYSVLTNTSLSALANWTSAGATNATSTNTCFTFPGRPASGSKMFVAIKKN